MIEIKYKNKKICLEPLRGIITQGEMLADEVRFHLPAQYGNLTLSELGWTIRAASEKDTLATATLTGTAAAGVQEYWVVWDVSADFTAVDGALSLMLVGTDADGNVVLKIPGDGPIWVRKAETGQYAPPEDAIQNALNGLSQAQEALESAEETLQDAAETLDGTTANFKVLGHYTTLSELQESVTSPGLGDAYGVGDPTTVYVWGGTSWNALPGVLVSPPLPMSIKNGGTGANNVISALQNLGAQSTTNLLVNPRFKYNSRGQSTYTGAVWTVDGWSSSKSLTINVINGGIEVISNGSSSFALVQRMNNNPETMNGKEFTLSVQANAEIYTVSAAFPDSTPETSQSIASQETPWGGISVWYLNTSATPNKYAVYISVSNGQSVTLTAAKLELGSVSTLQAELDNPPPEDVEKLKLDMYSLDPGRCAYLPWHNENLLDNWYFVGGGSQQGGGQFPINQRGQTSYTVAGYGIDRWTQKAGENVLLTDSGITISCVYGNSRAYYQKIPISVLRSGMTYTFSVLHSGGNGANFDIAIRADGESIAYFRTPNIPSEPGILSVTGTLSGSPSQNAMVTMQPMVVDSSITILAAKLELGYLSTLARKDEDGNWVLNDPPPNFQQELAKCQREQIMLDATNGELLFPGRTFSINETSCLFFIPLPVEMRINPTINSNSSNFSVWYNGANTPKALSTISSTTVHRNGITVYATCPSGIGGGQQITVSLNTGSTALLDSNL